MSVLNKSLGDQIVKVDDLNNKINIMKSIQNDFIRVETLDWSINDDSHGAGHPARISAAKDISLNNKQWRLLTTFVSVDGRDSSKTL